LGAEALGSAGLAALDVAIAGVGIPQSAYGAKHVYLFSKTPFFPMCCWICQ